MLKITNILKDATKSVASFVLCFQAMKNAER